MAAKIIEKVCPKCGVEVSGPIAKSVAAAMTRHNKAKHPTKRKPRAKSKAKA